MSPLKPHTESESLLKIVLSILLAVSVANALNMLAIYIPESETLAWMFSSFLLILGTIGIIAALLDTTIKDKIEGLKTLFIICFSLFSFSLARFFNFRGLELEVSTNYISYWSILLFATLYGFILIIWGWESERDWKYILIGIFIIAISAIFFILGKPLGIGGIK